MDKLKRALDVRERTPFSLSPTLVLGAIPWIRGKTAAAKRQNPNPRVELCRLCRLFRKYQNNRLYWLLMYILPALRYKSITPINSVYP
jgi:hypothetical protein